MGQRQVFILSILPGVGYNDGMKPTVYIETTIPSYYCDKRSSMAREIARTHEWWDRERADYECFISPVVLDELAAGDYALSRSGSGSARIASTASVTAFAWVNGASSANTGRSIARNWDKSWDGPP